MQTGETAEHIIRVIDDVRDRTFALTNPLSDADVEQQFIPIMSPLVWDMGHVANFEEWWLLREVDGRDAHDPRLDCVYNPFDNPRWTRGDLDILDRAEATEYLAEVRGEVKEVIRRTEFDPHDPLLHDGYIFTMVAQHEAQHQDTMLQAMNLRDDLAPYRLGAPTRSSTRRTVDDEERITVPAGSFVMGTNDRNASYDNERPGHEVWVDSFVMDRFPVTNRRFAAFIKAGGYEAPEWWSDGGREWLAETGHRAPQGWIPDLEGGWLARRFGNVGPLEPSEPVIHISFWEAEAFAAWDGGRLPTEAEWEKAAAWDPATGASRRYPWGGSSISTQHANVDITRLGPAPVGAYPAGASALGFEQMVGDVFEWTSSDFVAYPGYETFPYKEYSEVFFGDDYAVLRGAAWATSSLVARTTFRNWDYRQRRQIFAGLRVARDV